MVRDAGNLVVFVNGEVLNEDYESCYPWPRRLTAWGIEESQTDVGSALL